MRVNIMFIFQMRVLRNDFQRYNVNDEDSLEDFQQDDYGWKIIHSDVFRFPPYRALLSSILGILNWFLEFA